MNSTEFTNIAERLMSCPAAPYFETNVQAAVEKVCAEHGLAHERDEFGNILVRYGSKNSRQPLVLAAHMDHPGFEILKRVGKGRFVARFNGGVPDSYFRPGLPVRLLPGNVAAELGKRLAGEKLFELLPSDPESAGAHLPKFAVWELEDFAVRRDRIIGRSCDDLIGVAAILATLIELKRTKADVSVMGAISRAEEVGLQGALALADSRRLPKDALVISLETSKELPPVKMGAGVILRVGDRASVFDSTATRFLAEVANGLLGREPDFRFQRALMFGGTCEGTAYQEFGCRTAAVCVALGNYHNCHPGGRIAEEFVSLWDATGMTRLLVEVARQKPHYEQITKKLPERLQHYLADARRALRKKRG